MYRKIFLILIFLNFSLFALSQEENAIYLTLKEVSELALSNNFDIQLAQFDAQLKGTELDKVMSIYDTIVEAEIKFTDDRRKSASSFAGTKSETRDYNLGASQRFPSGTTLDFDFTLLTVSQLSCLAWLLHSSTLSHCLPKLSIY